MNEWVSYDIQKTHVILLSVYYYYYDCSIDFWKGRFALREITSSEEVKLKSFAAEKYWFVTRSMTRRCHVQNFNPTRAPRKWKHLLPYYRVLPYLESCKKDFQGTFRSKKCHHLSQQPMPCLLLNCSSIIDLFWRKSVTKNLGFDTMIGTLLLRICVVWAAFWGAFFQASTSVNGCKNFFYRYIQPEVGWMGKVLIREMITIICITEQWFPEVWNRFVIHKILQENFMMPDAARKNWWLYLSKVVHVYVVERAWSTWIKKPCLFLVYFNENRFESQLMKMLTKGTRCTKLVNWKIVVDFRATLYNFFARWVHTVVQKNIVASLTPLQPTTNRGIFCAQFLNFSIESSSSAGINW